MEWFQVSSPLGQLLLQRAKTLLTMGPEVGACTVGDPLVYLFRSLDWDV